MDNEFKDKLIANRAGVFPRFNPCSDGNQIQSVSPKPLEFFSASFNPCSNGNQIQRPGLYPLEYHDRLVSILVLMEIKFKGFFDFFRNAVRSVFQSLF